MMAKAKKFNPAEEYKSRKAREELEKNALLPPGLINHANTCFFNSTLQALMATPLLEDLLLFHPNTPIDPRRSPALTNGRRLEGTPQLEWEKGMPIADTFLDFVCNAWSKRQLGPQRISLPTRSVLDQLGAKYDQYLDFRQQDAHELLRHLLDGIHMEEYDFIKRRQPPPSTHHPKHPSTSSTNSNQSSSIPSEPIPENERLIPFPDMVFGGKLASIIVCESCKHVSTTYEDFMDLSLSIKSDEAKDRKRDRLKAFVSKFNIGTAFANPYSYQVQAQTALPRAHSLPRREESRPQTPPVPRAATPLVDDPGSGDRRKMSLDATTIANPPAKDESSDDKKKKNRHVSLQFRMGSKGKSREALPQLGSKDSEEKGKEKEKEKPKVSSEQADGESAAKKETSKYPDERQRLTPSPGLGRTLSTRLISRSTSVKAAKPPKASLREAAYLAAVLRDDTSSVYNPLALLHVGGSSSTSTPSATTTPPLNSPAWFKFGPTQDGVIECLTRFTAVEPLDGENSFACHSCWNLANPDQSKRKRRSRESSESSSDEDEEDDDMVIVPRPSKPIEEAVVSLPPTPPEDLDAALKRVPSFSAISHYKDDGSSSGVDLAASIASAPSTFPPSVADVQDAEPAPPIERPALAVPASQDSIPIISTTFASPTEPLPNAPLPLEQSLADQHKRYDSALYLSPNPSRDSVAGRSSQKSRQRSHFDSRTTGYESDGHSSIASGVTTDTSLSEDDNDRPSSVQRTLSKKQNRSAIRSQQVIHRRALKRYLIAVPPPVLVIHLKRFQQLSRTPTSLFGNFKKLDDAVPFPEFLDIRPFIAPRREDYGLGKRGRDNVSSKEQRNGKVFDVAKIQEKEPVLYRLYAVVVHIGNMLGGHYISYTALRPPPTKPNGTPSEKKPERQWSYISDKDVRIATLEEVLNSKAYLLFYERV